MTSNHSNLIIYTLTFKTYETFFLSLMEYAAFPFLNTLLEVFDDDEQQGGGDTRRQTPFGNVTEGPIMRKGNSHNSRNGPDRGV